jgi:hypothetical protein
LSAFGWKPKTCSNVIKHERRIFIVMGLSLGMPGPNLSLEAYQAKEIGQHNEKQRQGCDTDEISRYAADESLHLSMHL